MGHLRTSVLNKRMKMLGLPKSLLRCSELAVLLQLASRVLVAGQDVETIGINESCFTSLSFEGGLSELMQITETERSFDNAFFTSDLPQL